MTLYMHAPAFTERSLRWREYGTEQPQHGEIALVRIGTAWVMTGTRNAFRCLPTDTWRPESDR